MFRKYHALVETVYFADLYKVWRMELQQYASLE